MEEDREEQQNSPGAGDTGDKLQLLDKNGSSTCECMAQTFKKAGIVDSEACRITSSASHFQHYRLISLLQRRSSHCDDLQFILCWLALTGLVSHVMAFFCFKSDENNSLTVCELVPE